MNFKKWFLNEIFDSPLPIKWTKKTDVDWEGTFTIESDRQYIIKMIKDHNMPWEVIFELIVDNKRSQDITGTGNAAMVFSTVLNGVEQWLDSVDPDSFVLSAREPSRQSLYRRLLKMLPKIWEVEDLGSTFFVQNKTKELAYSGFSDSDFDDYYGD